MRDCVFCKIVKKEIPSEIVEETDNFVVFKDIKPSAPTHLLIVPKTHYKDVGGLSDELWAEVRSVALELQKNLKLEGFRLATNVGDAAMIDHAHVHFLGGIKKDRSV